MIMVTLEHQGPRVRMDRLAVRVNKETQDQEAMLDLQEVRVQLALQANKELMDWLVPLDLLDHLGLRVMSVLLERWVNQELEVSRVMLDLLVNQVKEAKLVSRVPLDYRVHKVEPVLKVRKDNQDLLAL